MKPARLIFLTLTGVIMTMSIHAQESSTYAVTQLTDHIYKLTIDGGGYTVKVIASIGPDGVLLVDAGQKGHAEALKSTLASMTNEIPKIIVNTHAHMEHIGGNAAFGSSPIIIGHEKLRTRMRGGSFLFEEIPDEALPDITFADSMSLYFNGEQIKLMAFPGAHDNCDIIVWFTGSKVACVGALSNGHHFPSVDGAFGDVRKYAEIVARAIAALPGDVRIVPGHGADCTVPEWRLFQQMLAQTADRVRLELAKGLDLAALQMADILREWQSFEGSYTDRNDWLALLVEGFRKGDAAAPPKVRPFEPLYRALQSGGVESALAAYRELKARRADAYLFDDLTLERIALKCVESRRHREAVAFAELCLAEFPQSTLAWRCRHLLGLAHEQLGERGLARENFRESLALNPENAEAAERLKKLEQPQGGSR